MSFSVSEDRAKLLAEPTELDQPFWDGLAEGKCLDLAQSFSLDNVNIKIKGSSDISKIKNSDAIIITAGIARKPGMSRDDLIETNFSIISNIGKAIKKYSPNSIYLKKYAFHFRN